MADPLDLQALAVEADTTPERIERLVEIGAITPDGDGAFGRGDVIRSRLLAAFEAEGITLEQIGVGLRERAMTLEFVDLFYPDPSPRTGRSFRAFGTELGERGRLLGPVVAAMGLPTPSPEAPTRVAEEAVLRELIETWGGVAEEYTLRAARIFGDSIRRAAEGWVALFDEAIARHADGFEPNVDDLVPRIVEPAIRVRRLTEPLLRWLMDRHMERTMNQLNIESLERELARRGMTAPLQFRNPAIAFVDVSGYTQLTAEHGDELAARTAVRLGELAEEAVRRRGGRVVKLLGDGVLLVFDDACVAAEVALALATMMADAGLPPAHGGVHAGPLIQRDGDVYGATVNVAARIAAQAGAGEILGSEAVRAECAGSGSFDFQPLGASTLKGVAGPVQLFRVTRASDTLAP